MICPICESGHCPETNIDDTTGCCLCYNIEQLNLEQSIISLCKACYRYAKTVDKGDAA